MLKRFSEFVISLIGGFLTKEHFGREPNLSDIEIISTLIKPADVILIDGCSRASRIIKIITQSPWSHAALYIGKLEELNLPQDIIEQYSHLKNEPLIIESEIGLGTVLSPLNKYKNYHVRLLRPREISEHDKNKVITFALTRLGKEYHLRHLLDLARFLFPWGIYPRRWRSVLFRHNALQPTKDICSSMIAASFQSVKFPILPIITRKENNQVEFESRNPLLYTPRDFDYSPFFDVIKYPLHVDANESGTWYTQIKWIIKHSLDRIDRG